MFVYIWEYRQRKKPVMADCNVTKISMPYKSILYVSMLKTSEFNGRNEPCTTLKHSHVRPLQTARKNYHVSSKTRKGPRSEAWSKARQMKLCKCNPLIHCELGGKNPCKTFSIVLVFMFSDATYLMYMYGVNTWVWNAGNLTTRLTKRVSPAALPDN